MAGSGGRSKSFLLERQRSMVMRAAEEGLSNLVVLAMEANPTADVTKIVAAKSASDVPLITACLKGHLDVVRNLVEKCNAPLDSRADITLEGQNCKGVTPLWAAVDSGNLDLVKYLVQKGAGVNVTNMKQSSPLRVAAYDGYLSIVKFLVEKGADVNSTNSFGNSVLGVACYNEHEDVAQYLIEHGADVNSCPPVIEGSDIIGKTALHHCAEKGNVNLCRILLAHGATITRCQDNETPLMVAARKGHDDIVELFLDTPDCSRDDKADALELLGTEHFLKDNVDQCLSLWQRAMEERRRPGKPVVWKREAESKVAAYGNAVEVQTMEELRRLKSSRDMDEIVVQSTLIRERVLGKTNEETTFMIKYAAAQFADANEYNRSIELLLHIFENLESVCPFKSHTVDVYKLMLSFLVDAHEETGTVTFSSTLTCLKRAVSDFERGEAEPPDNRSEAFLTQRQNLLKITLHLICLLCQALDRATSRESQEFREQVRAWVMMGYRDQKGNTPLHMACNADTTVFDTRDDHHTGCTFPAPEVVCILLDSGCDVSARNEAGQTALQVAQEQEGDQSEIVNILMAVGS